MRRRKATLAATPRINETSKTRTVKMSRAGASRLTKIIRSQKATQIQWRTSTYLCRRRSRRTRTLGVMPRANGTTIMTMTSEAEPCRGFDETINKTKRTCPAIESMAAWRQRRPESGIEVTRVGPRRSPGSIGGTTRRSSRGGGTTAGWPVRWR